MYTWYGTVMRDETGRTILAMIQNGTEICLWAGLSTKGQVNIPTPEGMEFGYDLKRYIEAQHKLLFEGERND